MQTFRQTLNSIGWPRVSIALIVSGGTALSIHVVMLNYLGVPYPYGYPRTGWPLFVNFLLQSLALLTVRELSADHFASLSFFKQTLFLFVLSAGLHESLRGFLMSGWVTTAWVFSFVSSLPSFLTAFYLGFPVAIFGRQRLKVSGRILSAVAIAIVLTWLVPFTRAVFTHVEDRISSLSHDSLWTPPYNWHVQVAAYPTYLEPTASCFFLAFLVWNRLPLPEPRRLASFVALAMAVDGSLIAPFIYPLFSKLTPLRAVMSESQFTLEHLALALMTGMFWRSSSRSMALCQARRNEKLPEKSLHP